jgi:hypothetical protein
VEIVAEPEVLVEEEPEEAEVEALAEGVEVVSDAEPIVAEGEAIEADVEQVVVDEDAVEVLAEGIEKPEEVLDEPIEEVVEDIPTPEGLDEEELEKILPIESEEDLEKVFADLAQGLGTTIVPDAEEELEDVDDIADAKRKKRKKRARVVEFDPDLGEDVVRRRRKRGGTEDWEEYDV